MNWFTKLFHNCDNHSEEQFNMILEYERGGQGTMHGFKCNLCGKKYAYIIDKYGCLESYNYHSAKAQYENLGGKING